MENLKAMPNSVRTEAQLLGAILSNQNKLVDVISYLNASDFYNTSHQLIYKAMQEMFKEGIQIDLTTISERLKHVLNEIGGITYLSELLNSSATGWNISEYANIIKEKSNKRNLIKVAMELEKKCYADQESSSFLVSDIEEKLFKVNISKENRLKKFDKVLEKTVKNIEDIFNNGGDITGIDTKFSKINEITGGLQKSDLIILAARPSMGKTTLALNLGVNMSTNNVVTIFSLEMSENQLAKRILSSVTYTDLQKINTGNLGNKDWDNIAESLGPLSNSKIFLDDTAGISVSEIKAKCKKIKIQHGLDIVIIDYLQLIEQKANSREQEISKISRALKQLAKELDVVVIALSQLSRAPEQRNNHRPMLSDLRESGSIEQDADIVMLLYRDEYYNSETEDKNIAECIFAKNRNGKVGTVKLAWLPQYQKFGTLDYNHGGN